MEKVLAYISFVVNVIILIGWVWKLQQKYVRNRVARRFFGVGDISIYFPLRRSERKAGDIASEDFQAVLSLAEVFRAQGLKCHFCQIVEGDVSEMDIKANSGLICGPKTSDRIKREMEADPHYQLVEDRPGVWKVRDISTNNLLLSPMDGSPSADADLGYLGRLSVQATATIL